MATTIPSSSVTSVAVPVSTCWSRFASCVSAFFIKVEPVAAEVITDVGTEFVENTLTAVASGQSVSAAIAASAVAAPIETANSLKQRLQTAVITSSSDPVEVIPSVPVVTKPT